ncbi:hypothetical protein H9Q72_008013 [Fusarium xylarioides]|uniref:RelA/SpoT domain-containing protein n=1 Tax=Fusarium xylarioides TaxID=221167 RepID=A0A9P7LNE0_9HYPO|nr:hypothetical protein H9Q70_001946 [Fusarium xylarioides]KAG5763883.1 hypothetical protein H9Q72_008013 [Fusarium xylarioides]KAG5786098.1 hypothetical protein H9Q73_000228 [Fusarium xylarioides]KAG5820146.1 hypothetical protein H9Q71_000684 [Fusarium xylarioides]
MSGHHGYGSYDQYDSDDQQDAYSHTGSDDQGLANPYGQDDHDEDPNNHNAAYLQKVEECLAYYGDPNTQVAYQNVAHDARDTLQDLLKETGTKGVVTCRTKAYDSLETKLRGMASDTDFTSFALKDNIFHHSDMGDLAAVRIGLYLPQDVIDMAKECQQRFTVAHLFGTVGSGRDAPQGDRLNLEGHSRGPWRSQDQYGSDEYWQHSGYKSWQMVVDWEGDYRVEIQIGTVVSQAWAEVQHNIIYKRPDDIMSTPTMKRMIDAINGLAITTEIILSELERNVETAKQEEKIRRMTEEQYDNQPITEIDEFFAWFEVAYWYKMPQALAMRWEPDAISVQKLVEFCSNPRRRWGLAPEMGSYRGMDFKRMIEDNNLLQTNPLNNDRCDIAYLLLCQIMDDLGIREEFDAKEEESRYWDSVPHHPGWSR